MFARHIRGERRYGYGISNHLVNHVRNEVEVSLADSRHILTSWHRRVDVLNVREECIAA